MPLLVLAVSVAFSCEGQAQVFANLHPCADDSGGVGSCTANEINIAAATHVSLLGLVPGEDSCVAGDTLVVTSIDAQYGLNTGVRYDPLLWIGQKGNDPRDPDPNIDPNDESVGSCYVTSAPESVDYPDLFDHLEGDDNDSCLDISNPDLDSVDLPYSGLNFEIECQDADSDGIADVHVLVTWVQNTNLLCGNQEGEVFGTGAPPKCNYSLISLGIGYLDEPPAASLTVVKQIESDNGGVATLDDFDVSVDAVEVDWDDPSSTTGGSALVASEPGTYTLSEADVPGYTEGAWSCIDDDEQEVPVTNGGLFSGADVTVSEGQHVTCSITNSDDAPTLTLVKSVTNDNGGNAGPGDFTLRLDGGIYSNTPFSSGDSPPVVANTAYTLGEDPLPGYSGGGVSCFDESAEEAVPHPVTLAPGQVVTCTIANDDIAPLLTLVKAVINDDGGEAGPGDFTLRLDGGDYSDEPFSSGATPSVAANTPYTLSEDPMPGYLNLGVTCEDDNSGDPVPHPVQLDEGQQVTCTLTNDDVAEGTPVLTLLKSVTNDNGGDAGPGDFQLRLDGGIYVNAPFSSGQMPPVVAGTPYTLSEDELPGYAGGGVICFDEGAEEVVPHPVTLSEGQQVTCTIANDDIAPELTVIKHVVNDDGGDAVAGDWTMVVTATNPSDDSFPGAEAPGTTITIDAGAYSVDESGGPAGYQKILGPGCAGSLEVGESATCTITGDDIQPSLTISKVILFNDEGPATLGDFDVSVDGVEVAWANPASTTGGTSLVATMAGSYTLSETALPDYDEGSWSCADEDGEVPVSNGGLFSGAEVTVMLAQHVSCGITNVFEGGAAEQSLTVAKVIVSDDEGTATLDEFNVSVDGIEVPWSDPGSTTGGMELVAIEARTYRLSEDELDDYEEGVWTCSDLDGPVPVSDGGAFSGADVTVSPGQHVTCTITNDDEPPLPPPPTEQSLTITKVIRNDNGGTAMVKDFDISVDGVEVDWWDPNSTTGDTELAADLPGTYRLSEADVDGYREGRWTCSDEDGEVWVSNDGHFSGADVTVYPGQHVHCTIINDDGFPEAGLVVEKVIISNNGGSAVVDDFNVSVNGTEVAWDNPASTTGGSKYVSGKPGTYTLSEAESERYEEGRWSCTDAEYRPVSVTNDGHFSGADVTVEPEQLVICAITNDDEKLQPDLSVRKTIDPDIGECGVIVGQQLDFRITVANSGPGLAEGVLLEDHWSWQLKPSGAPDMLECTSPKDRWIRCKLGNLEPGESREVGLGFMVGGHPGEEAYNLATVSNYPVSNCSEEPNECEIWFPLVGELALAADCGALPRAIAGIPYAESIEILGGELPYQADVVGLPDGFSGRAVAGEVRIEGCAGTASDSAFTVTLSDKGGCQDTSSEPAVCRLIVLENPDCPLSGLVSSTIPSAGRPTPDPDVLPNESVQKIVVDAHHNRYLVGFTYRDHSYAADPNGPYYEHTGNYDIRVVKYDDEGEPLWDKTYDTGNDDYGYAVALNPLEGESGLYVGGGVEVESGPHAWHDALLLEIDPDTGCPLEPHFQSAGTGTTSAYYDLATDGTDLYAVGERQRNETLSGEFGALISIFDHAMLGGATAGCEGDHHIIAYPYPPPEVGDTPGVRTVVREGGFDPTVAYSVKVPEPGCGDCSVLVGGRSASGGWVDRVITGDPEPGLVSFLSPGDLGAISVQDMAVPGDRVIVVGSTPASDMRVRVYQRKSGIPAPLWAWGGAEKGRLRGVATDEYGAVYAVGRSDGDNSAGLIFKFSKSGVTLDSDRLTQGSGVTFTDVAVFAPGSGVVAARAEEPKYDFGWLQVEFEGCEISETACPPP